MAQTAIRLMCPNLRCRTLLAVPITARGKNVRCRLCGTRIQVPSKSKGTPPTPAAAAADPSSANDTEA